MNVITEILKCPLTERCQRLVALFDTVSSKELEDVFAIVVDDIFGINDLSNWGLRHLESGNKTFNDVADFLSPCGPLFRVCYRILSNVYLRYRFRYDWLSDVIQKQLNDSSQKSFYYSKVHYDAKEQKYYLSLNALEYYLFHFAYHLVNPKIRLPAKESIPTQWKSPPTLYEHLVTLYLHNFLPYGTSVVQPPLGHSFTHSTLPSDTYISTQVQGRKSPLFKEDALMKIYAQNSSPTYSRTARSAEIWRTELVVRLFIDYWLVTENGASANQLLPNLFYIQTLPACSQHLTCVYIFIKHLNLFSYHTPHDDYPMNTFRRDVLSSNCLMFYQFFRYTIMHYPLDSCFSLLLESWLTYIQPWRYTDLREINRSLVELESRNEYVVTRSWFPFMAENLLTYTRIYYFVLERLSRADLTLYRYAFILYRISKVFAQPYLVEYLTEIEGYLEDDKTGGSINTWNSMILQNIRMMEVANYEYIPFRSTKYQNLLNQLIDRINQSINKLSKREEEKSQKSESFVDWFVEQMSGSLNDSYETADIPKVIQCLKYALTTLFMLHGIKIQEQHASETSHESSENVDTVDSVMKKTAILNRPKNRKVCDVRFEGDPDAQPPRSWEVAFLINVLCVFCKFINSSFSSSIQKMYYDNSLMGRIAREFLSPPQSIYYYESGRPPYGYAQRVCTVLPPRITLRWAANRYFLFCILFALFILKLLKISFLNFTLLFTFLSTLYVLIKAYLKPTHIANVQQQ